MTGTGGGVEGDPYGLGIDVGTTSTAAAVMVAGRVEVVALESHRLMVPTIVHSADGELTFGSVAAARAATDPDGADWEFKRRIGDQYPVMLGGAPYSADRLIALYVTWVIALVGEERGGPPAAVVVSHPANWTEHQLHLLRTSLGQAGAPLVSFVAEPEAAAEDFASVATLSVGDRVLVYDLGGGTFDVALLRRRADGFEPVGDPAGVERLGGIDFDQAVYEFVLSHVPAEAVSAARAEGAGRIALLQLRRGCVDAKEALSHEVSVEVPVLLPTHSSTVRVTRADLENMIRPMLHQTVEVVRHVLAGAGVAPGELSAVLLVGGSSRIPLVSQLIADELAAPVRVDAHPKLVVSRGAARRTGGPARSFPTPIRPAHRRSPAVVAVAAVVVVSILAFTVWAVTRGGADSAPSAGPTPSTAPGVTSGAGGGPTTLATPSSGAPPGTSDAVPARPPGECGEPQGRLAFASDRDGDDFEIYVQDLAGGPPIRLTDNDVQDYHPAWSPDGTAIVHQSGPNGQFDLRWVAADGSGANGPVLERSMNDLVPSLSPTGTRTAYGVNDGTQGDIWIAALNEDLTARNEVPLVDGSTDDRNPSWAADGSGRIAFVRGGSDAGGAIDVYVVAAEGGPPEPLLDDPSVKERHPRWSPDGSRLALELEEEIWWVAIPASDERLQISDGPATEVGRQPAWSPDGCFVAYLAETWTQNGRPVAGSDCEGPTSGCELRQDVRYRRADAAEPSAILIEDLGQERQPAWGPPGS